MTELEKFCDPVEIPEEDFVMNTYSGKCISYTNTINTFYFLSRLDIVWKIRDEYYKLSLDWDQDKTVATLSYFIANDSNEPMGTELFRFRRKIVDGGFKRLHADAIFILKRLGYKFDFGMKSMDDIDNFPKMTWREKMDIVDFIDSIYYELKEYLYDEDITRFAWDTNFTKLVLDFFMPLAIFDEYLNKLHLTQFTNIEVDLSKLKDEYEWHIRPVPRPIDFSKEKENENE